VLGLDLNAFFETIDRDLFMRAVEKHVPEKRIRLHIPRGLECPVVLEDGLMESRTRDTSQRGAISPLPANLYLHHAFDHWMTSNSRGLYSIVTRVTLFVMCAPVAKGSVCCSLFDSEWRLAGRNSARSRVALCSARIADGEVRIRLLGLIFSSLAFMSESFRIARVCC